MRTSIGLTTIFALVFAVSGCAEMDKLSAVGGPTAHAEQAKQRAEMPHCVHSHGTVAVYEPKNKWWEGLGLPSPEAMIKVMVLQSGCFVPLDRGSGFDLAQQERELASGGQLRGGSNVGKGQMKAADYILVPDITSKNADASGSALTAIVGGLVGGTVGGLIGNIHVTGKTADVVLTITDVRSSEQLAMTEGHGEHTDWGFGVGGGAFGGGVLGAAGASAYQNTDVGQVVILAYVDAYRKMLGQLGYLPTNASAANAPQALAVTHAGHLFKGPSAKSGAVRALSPGMTLYPTGNQSGGWREVKDELGNVGWVAYQVIELAK